jgi:protein gp37
MSKSKIEWTEVTWNPTTGCDKVSQGCKNCYAEALHKRLQGMGQKKYDHPFLGTVKMHEDALLLPLSWKKSRMIFVNSMSDLFHKDVPFEFIDKVFAVIGLSHIHKFQILTKRPDIMRRYFTEHYAGWKIINACKILYELLGVEVYERLKQNRQFKGVGLDGSWPMHNVWLGTSVEDQETATERIPFLIRIPAAVRFLSCEPLLGKIEFSDVTKRSDAVQQLGRKALFGIDWVIAGGESGHGARPMHPYWVRSLRDQCHAAGVPFFFKQWGEFLNHALPFRSYQHWVDKAESWLSGWRRDRDLCIDVNGKICRQGSDFKDAAYPVYPMRKSGKANSGRSLDGREWNEFPKGREEVVS